MSPLFTDNVTNTWICKYLYIILLSCDMAHDYNSTGGFFLIGTLDFEKVIEGGRRSQKRQLRKIKRVRLRHFQQCNSNRK